jgi:hypothetical protein
MGNWNPQTLEKVYSLKMPLIGLREMAGHGKEIRKFWIARGGVVPPEDCFFPKLTMLNVFKFRLWNG